MFSTVRIAPSIISPNFMDMERDIRMLEEAGADIIHVDVMDGHFVPNLTIGVPFIKQLRAITDLPIDVHLMISNPQEQIDWYLDLDPDYVSVHIEAVPDEDELHTLLRHIRERGAHPALKLKPQGAIVREGWEMINAEIYFRGSLTSKEAKSAWRMLRR